jgi:hypothetical protein
VVVAMMIVCHCNNDICCILFNEVGMINVIHLLIYLGRKRAIRIIYFPHTNL